MTAEAYGGGARARARVKVVSGAGGGGNGGAGSRSAAWNSSKEISQEITNVDRLSSLPDDVLIAILDKLEDTMDAVATTVLSRRYVQLPWQINRPHLSASSSLLKALSPMRRFMASIEAMECLTLDFFLTDEFVSAIQHLLSNAIDSGRIQALCFEIRTMLDGMEKTGEQMLEDTQRLLRFAGSSTNLFASLKKLHLKNLWLIDSDIEVLLTTCRRLEELKLYHCNSSDGAVLVIDVPPQSELKELEFRMCYYEQVELRSVPKLTRLTIKSWLYRPPLLLCLAPFLEGLSLTNSALRTSERFKLSELLAPTRNLSSISLNFENQMIWIRPEDAQPLNYVFGNLTFLSLHRIFAECNLTWMMFLLKAAPCLEKFHVAIQRHSCCHPEDVINRMKTLHPKKTRVLWNDVDFKHTNLQKLEIFGFEPDDKCVKFARLVMERSIRLEKVILCEEELCIECNFENDETFSTESWYPRSKDEKEFWEKKLIHGMSSRVKVFIL
uniref:At1g61320/AtMIF1 LRR domain-containing protein n=1 Tax=Leersia perrieri TaxID=77586 RepID=A0A0D9V2B3_9ORYZ